MPAEIVLGVGAAIGYLINRQCDKDGKKQFEEKVKSEVARQMKNELEKLRRQKGLPPPGDY